MDCERITRQLSGFLDGILETEQAVQISQHLGKCPRCKHEFERLSTLRTKLGELRKTEAPDYLYHLIQRRLQNARQETWRWRLRDALEYRWSKIRTTESLWYVTRALGTAMTTVFFFMFCYALNPIYLGLHEPGSDRGSLVKIYPQQLGVSVLKNLGLNPIVAQKRSIGSSEPRINDLYLLNFGQSVSREGQDDTVSVVTVVDRSGATKIQGVLEYPVDPTLLTDFNSMISSARCRPAIQNGRPVDSHLVLTFSKISVYD